MKTRNGIFKWLSILNVTSLLMLAAVSAPAAVRYVNVNSSNPSPPYLTWATAATNIQDAVDVALPGEEIVVTNGVYSSGERASRYGTGTNRVAVTKPLKLRSVNGPDVTVIDGLWAVRCVYLTNGATLDGFTLTNGAATNRYAAGAGTQGGGVFCESSNEIVLGCVVTANSALDGGGAHGGVLNNCTFSGNSGDYGGGAENCTLNNCVLATNVATVVGGGAAVCTLNGCALIGNVDEYGQGGGAFGSTLNNCTVAGNSVTWSGGGGGGVSLCTANNCTVTGNSAQSRGGGADGGTLNNCIIYFNTAFEGPNYRSDSTLNNCCTTPLPAVGVGNISDDPQLTSFSHISVNSPCRGAGNPAFVSGVDIDGEPWANPPSIGCDEVHPGSETGPLTVVLKATFTNFVTGYEASFVGSIGGYASANRWEFGDGTVLSNRVVATHAWATPGDYQVVVRAYNLSNPAGVCATVTVHVNQAQAHYVAVGNLNPVAPYLTWATAATNIQDAVDAALVGEEIVATNGVYQSGERAGPADTGTNRVAAMKPVKLRSVNGAAVTVIDGLGAVRCVYLADGVTLAGFTLRNGVVTDLGTGGGVYCESSDAVVSDCVLTGNSAEDGGASWGGTVNNCTLTGNSAAVGGGAYRSTLNSCTLGSNSASAFGGGVGGASTLNNCTLTGNSAEYDGGGADFCTLNDCTLSGNSGASGGGAAYCTLKNCTVTGNSAYSSTGGGASQSTLNNCTLTGNSARTSGGGADICRLNNCMLASNSATVGGGAYGGTLNNCTLVGNAALLGGGAGGNGTLNNCIAYFNNAPEAPNYNSSTLNYCCTTPMPTNGVGNFTNSPLFLDLAGGNLRLQSDSPCIDAGNNDYGTTETDLDGNPRISNGKVDVGAYEFVFRSGPVTLFVNVNNATPKSPYVTWATAATNIQDAVDVGLAGDEILVTNGVYRSGDRVVDFITNRVVLTKSLTLRSVNGAGGTIIDGLRAARCVYLMDGAALVGFTLTNGVAFYQGYGGGGGVRCESSNAVVSDCVLVTNAAYDGGGAFGGTLNNCTLVDNGAFEGGGAESSRLNNCILARNGAADVGGGADSSTLNNCTLVDNGASYQGGGARTCTLNNCIVYFNTAQEMPNYSFSTLNYCCTTPIPTDGVGSFTNSPLFVDLAGGNLRLESDSPCIDAGNNNYVTTDTDLDGNPRISGGTVDVGAYEFVFTPDMEVARLILIVEDSNLETKKKKPLLATLEAALASFERGNVISGVNQLKAFQNKVEAQVARIDAALAGELVDRAQQIIDEVQRK